MSNSDSDIYTNYSYVLVDSDWSLVAESIVNALVLGLIDHILVIMSIKWDVLVV